MSSRKEGFPNVVLEALYLKTPVVASNCVDFSRVIESGVNGYIVEKGMSFRFGKESTGHCPRHSTWTGCPSGILIIIRYLYKDEISVIIPSYKPQDWIYECLSSLAGQTFEKRNLR